jgi:hypothetical protein
MGQTGFISRQNAIPKISRNCLVLVKKEEEVLVDLEAVAPCMHVFHTVITHFCAGVIFQ